MITSNYLQVFRLFHIYKIYLSRLKTAQFEVNKWPPFWNGYKRMNIECKLNNSNLFHKQTHLIWSINNYSTTVFRLWRKQTTVVRDQYTYLAYTFGNKVCFCHADSSNASVGNCFNSEIEILHNNEAPWILRMQF